VVDGSYWLAGQYAAGPAWRLARARARSPALAQAAAQARSGPRCWLRCSRRFQPCGGAGEASAPSGDGGRTGVREAAVRARGL